MKIGFAYKHLDASPFLEAHCAERLKRLERFEIKPMEARVVFSLEGHEHVVEICLDEGRKSFKAHSACDDFQRAAEMTLNKLQRQLCKDKSRVKNHRNPEASTVGKLARLNAELEYDGADALYKKAG